MLAVGHAAYARKDWPAAMKAFQQSAEAGSAEGAWELSLMHAHGKTGVVDKEEARKWLKIAAEGGAVKAQMFLAQMSTFGRGGYEKDESVAFEYLTRAADQGNAHATHQLGVRYLYAVGVEQDLDKAIEHLEKAIEPMMKSLRETLEETGALDDRYVLLTSDHGHTRVTHDDRHSLGIDGDGEPAQVLEKAGFTLRPFELEVDNDVFFDSVLAYQGALAYVYVADRSTCASGETPCDWSEPARNQDIEAVAEAFWDNNESGDLVPEMRDTLDMVLVRTRASAAGDGDVFEVYLGDGRTQRLADYLAEHPHPNYVQMPERMQALASGKHGDRAGDVILVAHNGDRDRADERFYFASPYQSWHGSPSHRDSDIPLIVAHRDHSTDEIRQRVDAVLKGEASQRLIGELILRLRAGEATPADGR